MNAQTPNPDKMTPAEIRQHFAELRSDIENLSLQLLALREVFAQAAASKPAASTETFKDFDATEIIMTYSDKGEPAYKIKGQPFTKFGVRAWPEVLPELGIDPEKLKPGPNAISIRVRALMFEATSESGTVSMQPRKIVGKGQ